MKTKTEMHSGSWESATWDGAEAARRAADRKLSFRQKLEWNAQVLAWAKNSKNGAVNLLVILKLTSLCRSFSKQKQVRFSLYRWARLFWLKH